MPSSGYQDIQETTWVEQENKSHRTLCYWQFQWQTRFAPPGLPQKLPLDGENWIGPTFLIGVPCSPKQASSDFEWQNIWKSGHGCYRLRFHPELRVGIVANVSLRKLAEARGDSNPPTTDQDQGGSRPRRIKSVYLILGNKMRCISHWVNLTVNDNLASNLT